jgi:hypothetical protein
MAEVDVSAIVLGSRISSTHYVEMIYATYDRKYGNLTHPHLPIERPRVPPYYDPNSVSIGQLPGFSAASLPSQTKWDFAKLFTIHRELLDPTYITTVKLAAGVRGLDTSAFVPYLRDYNSNTILPTTYSAPVGPRTSVIFLSTAFDEMLQNRFLNCLMAHREILPARVAP